MSMVSSTEARTPGPAGSAAPAPRPSPRSFGTRLWWSPLPVSCVIRELPTRGNGHGESPNRRHSRSVRRPHGWTQVPTALPLRKVTGGDRGFDRDRGAQLSHFCVERLDTQPTRHGHPVITVADEAGVVDLQ